MNIKNKFTFRFLIGFPLGMVICLIIATLIGTLTVNDGALHYCSPDLIKTLGGEAKAIILQEFISGIFGSVAIGMTAVYDIEKWSILKSTAVHFIASVSMYYITAFVLKWLYIKNVKENLLMLIMLIIAYAFIWLINYLIYKSEVKKINSNLTKIKDTDNEE